MLLVRYYYLKNNLYFRIIFMYRKICLYKFCMHISYIKKILLKFNFRSHKQYFIFYSKNKYKRRNKFLKYILEHVFSFVNLFLFYPFLNLYIFF